MAFIAVGTLLGPSAVFAQFVLVGNPLIVMVIMGYMHLDQQTVGLITLVGLVAISASAYMILYSHQLHEWLAPYLDVSERKVPHREMDGPAVDDQNADVLLFGLWRYGTLLAFKLREEARIFEDEGVDLVLVPCADAAEQAADRLVAGCIGHRDTVTLGESK